MVVVDEMERKGGSKLNGKNYTECVHDMARKTLLFSFLFHFYFSRGSAAASAVFLLPHIIRKLNRYEF